MSVFDLPRYTGIVLFVILVGIYWLWRWIRFDESEPTSGKDRSQDER